MKKDVKTVVKEWIEILVVAISLALVIRYFVIQAFKIPSGSMIPTLIETDHLFVNKSVYRFIEPKRADIIVFSYPKGPRRDFIKRAIAFDGEEIAIKNKLVYINGKPISEPYAIYTPGQIFERDNYPTTVIPKNAFFMMGDNRDNSSDSRFWGFVRKKSIKGQALVIYWPIYNSRAFIKKLRIGLIK